MDRIGESARTQPEPDIHGTPAVRAAFLGAEADALGRAWMLAFQDGDESAFDRIVLGYRSAILRFLHRYVQDAHRADDIAQEVFLRVYRARRRYRPTAGFRTWLFTIATRLCLNEIRSRTRERRAIVPMPRTGEGSEEPALGIADERSEPAEREVEKRELEEAVDAAIAGLPPAQRAAMLLVRFEDLSYAEIGETLGISVSAVKSLINRAREKLRAALRRFIKE